MLSPARIFSATIILFSTMQATGATSGGLLVDPGHSPRSPGATSCTGRPEHLYNTVLAESVAAYLSENEIPVTLSRRSHDELSLSGRAKSAAGKSLMLSIHHDSVQPHFITGENGRPVSTKAEGYSIFVSQKNRHYAQSLKYAYQLAGALRSRGLRPSRHHAEKIAGESRQLIDAEQGIYLFNDLVVLKNSDAPAVLFEAAVIVSPKDEAKASSVLYRKLIAESVAEMLQ